MVPKDFRAWLQVQGQSTVVMTWLPGRPGCVEVRTVPSFQAYQQAFRKAKRSALLERFGIVYFGGAQRIDLDRTGRVLIPPALRKRLGVSDGVAFVGIDEDRFQLWKGDSLDEVYAFCDEHADEIQDALANAMYAAEATAGGDL